MLDSLGRNIDYLRISITDRCNMRCMYCMPPSGVEWIAHDDVLTFEEILRLCRIMTGLGVRKIKITGGEPLVRKGALELIRAIKNMPGIDEVTLTSNGLLLYPVVEELAKLGLDGLNVSLDTLNAETFKKITGSSNFAQALAAIERAVSVGLRVKINCVPMRGINSMELADIATFARQKVSSVRFIELMPIGCGNSFEPVLRAEIVKSLEQTYGKLTPFDGRLGNGPASYYALEGFCGKIGFISALSHEFCASCNRLRLTSDGFLKACLASNSGAGLLSLLRGGASDAEISSVAQSVILSKPYRHHFTSPVAEDRREQRKMFSIGG